MAEDAPRPGDTGEDALARLREQVDAAQEAARRVAEQAAQESASRRGDIPPAGYATPGEEGAGASSDNPELRALVSLLELVRELVPREVQQQLVELVRELLALVRALIDLIVGRLERQQPEPVEVEDIPLS